MNMSFRLSPPIFNFRGIFPSLSSRNSYPSCTVHIDTLATARSLAARRLGMECQGSPTGRQLWRPFAFLPATSCSTRMMMHSRRFDVDMMMEIP